jgi:hypothetical protein
MTRRHSIFRSTFHDPRGKHTIPFIAEFDPEAVLIPATVLLSFDSASAKMQLLKTIRRLVNISNNFAVRWTVIMRPGAADVYLISHHIALDGTSMSYLSAEFLELLGQLRSTSSVPDSDSPTASLLTQSTSRPEPFYRAHLIEVRTSSHAPKGKALIICRFRMLFLCLQRILKPRSSGSLNSFVLVCTGGLQTPLRTQTIIGKFRLGVN